MLQILCCKFHFWWSLGSVRCLLIFSYYGLKIAAMFKIGNSKELPTIPDHLSDEGKDFIRQCLQRDPSKRPSASELLQHPFIKNAAPLEKSTLGFGPTEQPSCIPNVPNTKVLFWIFQTLFFTILFVQVAQFYRFKPEIFSIFHVIIWNFVPLDCLLFAVFFLK